MLETIKLINLVPPFHSKLNYHQRKSRVRTMLNPSQLITSLTVASSRSMDPFGAGPEIRTLMAVRLDFQREGRLVKRL